MRTFLRALRLLPAELEWHATVWSPRPAAPAGDARPGPARAGHGSSDADDRTEAEALAARRHRRVRLRRRPDDAGDARARARAGAIVVATRLPVYEEVLADGERRLAVRARRGADARGASAAADRRPGALPRRARTPPRGCGDRLRLGAGGRRARRRSTSSWSARRHDRPGRHAAAPAAAPSGQLIDVDLHMHTDHSYDCATPVEVLLAEARARGLGAIAVTDHNEISGALEARAKASASR